MKFGLYLQDHVNKEWSEYYVNYDELKRMIRVLADVESKQLAASPSIAKFQGFSLTVPPPTNAAAMPQAQPRKAPGEQGDSDEDTVKPDSSITHEVFFDLLEKEIQKVHNFTHKKVEEVRSALRNVAKRLGIDANSVPGNKPLDVSEDIRAEVDRIGQEFLKLEKYVNLNYTGFHKILKKHDRWLTNPCRAFYLQRLQNHNWTRGDYSDVLVLMSRIWSCLRGDVVPEAVQQEKQDFVRTTTKYWVREEDVSQVKYVVLQQLPVFLQEPARSSSEKQADSQLINSVYLDNATLELYKGRLDKTPGAIAIRFRWYGTGTPELVFVERKTHREAWAMEVSVKERFTVHASEIPDLLRGHFNKEPHLKRMKEKGKSAREVEEWLTLVTEVEQAINSKQLVPTLRTQYMRTAFQIPYDATVRISLDTNLLMLTETGRLGGNMDRWYRDPGKPVPKNEITRFPHSVLEIKLQLKDESAKPQWVTELVESGMVQEVHKFSKFIHGCAVLLSEEVQAMPYWIDDPSLKDSIIASGSQHVIAPGASKSGANSIYSHLLPNVKDQDKRKPAPTPRWSFDDGNGGVGQPKAGGGASAKRGPPQQAMPLGAEQQQPQQQQQRIEDMYYDEEPGCCDTCCSRLFGWAQSPNFMAHFSTQKVEPKLFFANERTFIHWLNMAVTLSSLAAAVLAFSPGDSLSEMYGLILLPVSLIFACYALYTYKWRAAKIRTREQSRWDDPMGPILLGSAFTLALTAQLAIKIYYAIKHGTLAPY